MGIKEELVDPDFPMIYVHKTKWKEMLEAFEKDENEKLKNLLGEDLDLKGIINQNKVDREEIHATE